MIIQFNQKGSDKYLKCTACERFTHANNNKVVIEHKKSCTEPDAQPTQEQIKTLRTFIGSYSWLCTLSGSVQLAEGEEEALRKSGHSIRDILSGNHDH